MVGRRAALPAAIVLAAALTGAALIAVVLRDEPQAAAESPREADVRPTIRTALRPDVHRFGETVQAQLELLVRGSELQADTLGPGTDFDPYEVVGSARRELFDFGGLALVRYTITLRCLKQACLPETRTGEFQFSSASVGWRTPAPPGRRLRDRRLDQRGASGQWPAIKVASRLTPRELEEARWRSSLAEPPAPTFRVAPSRLAAGLLGGAAALVLAAGALVAGYVRDVRRRSEAERVEAAPEALPLEQALAYVDDARSNGDLPAQRIALETLARELRERGESGLAGRAERLAWSPESPAAVEVEELAATVRRLDGGSA